jgi:tetratricopeptide (TPR) repeat protein
MENKQTPLGFAQTRLPWLIAAGALVVFLATLNIWINVRSLPIVAKITGWDWTPPTQLPLFYLLTYPFRLLPEGILPIALNILTALCSALTLGLLARSVALLPHDRTHEQRVRERSEFSLLSTKWNWIPPLVAAAVCGLQLTFWEHSTAATGEALDLLIFAYCIRCLLEYRIDPRESWLVRLAFVYGLGVTNNWALIGFFPLFVAAIIWIRGLSFFRLKFLLKMLAAGILGLLLYAFIPILWAALHPETGFWEVLKLVLATQKSYLGAQPLRQPAMVLALTSILPVVVMGIRWPSSFGDTSAFGAMLTNILFRVVHLTFLAACLWMAFDQAFSPRKIGLRLPFLTFYYLGALAIGYYSAYALLVFTEPPRKAGPPSAPIMTLLNPIVRTIVFAVAVAAPIALLVKNYPAVRASNGKLIRDFAAITTELLPKGKTYIISDDSFQNVIMRGYLNKQGQGKDYILIDSRALENVSYHLELSKHYGDLWPKVPSTNAALMLNPGFVQAFVADLAKSNTVLYLHPSFGYYFEKVYQVSDGVVYKLNLYENDQVFPSALKAEEVQKNNAFWTKTDEFLKRLSSAQKYDSMDPEYISQFYSRALNNWGVQVQRMAEPAQAKTFFAKAVELNTNNIPATLNLEFNQLLASGKPVVVPEHANLEERMGGYRNWNDVLKSNGPFDEPTVNQELGRTFLGQGLYRQGLQNIYRVIHFQPTNYSARVTAARGLIYGGWPAKALEEVKTMREKLPLSTDQSVELINVESVAYYHSKDKEKAEKILLEAEKTFPEHPTLLAAKTELYQASGENEKALIALDAQLRSSKTNYMIQLQKAEMLFTMERYDEAEKILAEVVKNQPTFVPALMYKAFVAIQTKHFDAAKEMVEKTLRLDPDNEQALIYQSIIQMENKSYDAAISTLNLILDENKDHLTALRNRALVNLKAEHLEEAKEDYEHLRNLAPNSYAVHYGLAEVARLSKDNKEAIKNYELYLKYFDASGASGNKELQKERAEVEQKLQALKAQQK